MTCALPQLLQCYILFIFVDLMQLSTFMSVWVCLCFELLSFQLLFLLTIVFYLSFSDAGVLEYRCADSKDTLLGSGDGRMAPPAGHSSIEVVPPGHRAGSDE